MIQITCGNVLLTPATRRHLIHGLRRANKLGSRLGGFTLSLCLRRTGRTFDVRADVADRAGPFRCHARGSDWATVVRHLIRNLTERLHRQLLARAVVA